MLPLNRFSSRWVWDGSWFDDFSIFGGLIGTPGFPRGLTGKESTCNVGDLGLIPGLGRFPGEGNGNPLPYSGLENAMDYIKSMGSQRVRHDWATFTFTFRNPSLSDLSQSLGCYKVRKWLVSYFVSLVWSAGFSPNWYLDSTLLFTCWLDDAGPREKPKEPSGWEVLNLQCFGVCWQWYYVPSS